MSCECLVKFNEQLREHNVVVQSQSVRTWIGDDPRGILTERVALQTYKFEPSPKRKPAVFPTFCPFCGVPYISPGAEISEEST